MTRIKRALCFGLIGAALVAGTIVFEAVNGTAEARVKKAKDPSDLECRRGETVLMGKKDMWRCVKGPSQTEPVERHFAVKIKPVPIEFHGSGGRLELAEFGPLIISAVCWADLGDRFGLEIFYEGDDGIAEAIVLDASADDLREASEAVEDDGEPFWLLAQVDNVGGYGLIIDLFWLRGEEHSVRIDGWARGCSQAYTMAFFGPGDKPVIYPNGNKIEPWKPF